MNVLVHCVSTYAFCTDCAKAAGIRVGAYNLNVKNENDTV
jgi:hypothetical protein